MNVLVVGFGRYGRWITRVCREKLGDTVRAADREDAERLPELCASVDVAILCLPLYPRGLAANAAAVVVANLPDHAMVIDISAAKFAVHKVLRGSGLQYALFHPMKAPPADLTLGDAPLVVSEMRIYPVSSMAQWLARFREALGGREIRVPTVHQQDCYTYVEQGIVHQMLLAAAETLVRANLSLEAAIEAGSPVSRPFWEAVKKHFGGGNSPEVFAGIQSALAENPAIRQFMEVPAFSLANTVEDARKGSDELVTRWVAAQTALGLAPKPE